MYIFSQAKEQEVQELSTERARVQSDLLQSGEDSAQKMAAAEAEQQMLNDQKQVGLFEK